MPKDTTAVSRKYSVHKTPLNGKDLISLPGIFYEKLEELKESFSSSALIKISVADDPDRVMIGYPFYVSFICENFFLISRSGAILPDLLDLRTSENTDILIERF